MNPIPDKLPSLGYELLDHLDHADLQPFVQRQLKLWNPVTISFMIAILLCFALLVLEFYRLGTGDQYSIAEGMSFLFAGLLVALALIPIHEYIHIVAYRAMGARDTSFEAVWKKFYFLAIAHLFVANRRQFTVVALAPFTVISLLLLVGIAYLPQGWSLTLSGGLLMHTLMCSGDFGLLSYFAAQRDKHVLTYDDKENKVSYFCGKLKA